MTDTANDNSREGASPSRALVQALALGGGVVLMGVAGLVVANVTARGVLDTSIDGTFDLVKIGAALCVFLFLPLCQARRGNIMVDTFTTWLPPGLQRGLDALWDALYGVMMGTIGVCMLIGAYGQFQSKVVTTQLAVPLWPFNLMAALLLLVLAGICAMTTVDRLSGPKTRRLG